MSNIDVKWTQVATVPPNKLKTISFGALKGKSDINPQWRIKAMTEVYGLCGIGWYHELREKWSEVASNGVVMAFCLVNVYIKVDGEWSNPICGMGGNEIVSLAKGELKPSDEGWKMSYTDALGTALKSIGVASEIYEGNFDGSKYQKLNQSATIEPPKETHEQKQPEVKTPPPPEKSVKEILKEGGISDDEYIEYSIAHKINPLDPKKLEAKIKANPAGAVNHIKEWKTGVITTAEKAINDTPCCSLVKVAEYCDVHNVPMIKFLVDLNLGKETIDPVLSWMDADSSINNLDIPF